MYESDDLLVHVKAQVMTSNDEIGGWIPMGMGGLSSVALRKRSPTTTVYEQGQCRHEYLIHGQRLSDQSEVLNCILRKDLWYQKPNPTFHHWKTDEKRFGLTFQTPGDARAFHLGVKRAVGDLLGSSPEKKENGTNGGDDEVFVTLDLPLSRKDSATNSASTTSTTTSSPAPQSPAYVHDPFTTTNIHAPAHHHLHKIDYGPRQPIRKNSPVSSDKSLSNKSISSGESRESKEDNVWVRNEKRPSLRSNREESTEVKDSYYVHFTTAKPAVNEYSYPALEPLKTTPVRETRSSMRKQTQMEYDSPVQAPLPTKVKRTDRSWNAADKNNCRQSKHLISKRSRCAYCNEMFQHDDKDCYCQDAPDRFQQCIERASCIVCARGMLYHCMADTDHYYDHPCVCDSSDENNTKKWTALTFLSFLVPCLWCYWPLMGCHQCGLACGCCARRHKAAQSTTTTTTASGVANNDC